MIDENTKHHWLKIVAIALTTFVAAFLAFYIVMEIMINRINNPMYNVERLEKLMEHQIRDFEHLEDEKMENPFLPKMRPMIVNLVKEPNEYKVIIDLLPLNGNENSVNVKVEDDKLTVHGEVDKNNFGRERIINFTQTYYLDEKLDVKGITKERKGNKYIVTIPFEQ